VATRTIRRGEELFALYPSNVAHEKWARQHPSTKTRLRESRKYPYLKYPDRLVDSLYETLNNERIDHEIDHEIDDDDDDDDIDEG